MKTVLLKEIESELHETKIWHKQIPKPTHFRICVPLLVLELCPHLLFHLKKKINAQIPAPRLKSQIKS